MCSLEISTPAAQGISVALADIGRWLQQQGYRFITVTPATHKIVNDRSDAPAQNLRDIFGWSQPFRTGQLDAGVFGMLDSHELIEHLPDGLARSRVRFSSLDAVHGKRGEAGSLYAHSAYPTLQTDSVFFGPDTWRFVALIRSVLQTRPLAAGARILDVGCGAGPGGIEAALASVGSGPRLVLSDINARALQFAQANASIAGLAQVDLRCGDLYEPVPGAFDLILANPPYLVDPGHRAYRDGGGALGATLSERIVSQGVARLTPGGRLILYTGSAIVDGKDLFYDALQPLWNSGQWQHRYWELDPDVFGQELQSSPYRNVDRIAAVALVVTRAVEGKAA